MSIRRRLALFIPTGGGGPPDTTPPTLSSPTGTGAAGSGSGSVVSDEAGTLWFKADGSATATDPGAGAESAAGWLSASMLASTNSVSFGALAAGTYNGHFLGVDAAGNRSSVVNSASFVVTAPAAGGNDSVIITQLSGAFGPLVFGNRR